MPYIQQSSPPPNKILTFSLRNFVGGLNNQSEIIGDNQATSVLNMAFTNDTLMERRKGYELFDEFNPSSPFVSITEFRPYKDPDELIRATSTEVFSGSTKIADVSGDTQFENFNGKLFFLDGNSIQLYGKFPQESTTYEKVEGTPVSTHTTFTLANPPEDFTPLDTSHTRGIVRYDFSTMTLWYEPCQNEIDSTNLGSNVIPEKPKYIASHNGRLFISGSERDDDNVFISDVRNPYYFPVYLPIQLPPNSDKVRGLYVYDDSVVIGREEDIYVIHGETNNTSLGLPIFRLRKLNSHTGIANQDAMQMAHNYLFFLGSDGVAYSLASTNYDDKTLATRILSRDLDLFADPLNISLDDIRGATGFFYDSEWYLSIGDLTLVYSYRMQAWTVFNNMNAESFYDLDDTLIWGDINGRTGKFSDEYLDYGVPYSCHWASKRFSMDDASIFKQFREFYLVSYSFDEFVSDIRIRFEVDYADVLGETLIKNKISRFGSSKWGERFINRNINQSAPFVIGRRGRLIKFIMSNGYDPSESVSTLDGLTTYPNRKEGTLVYVDSESSYYQYNAETLEWDKKDTQTFNQAMKVFQLNGDYEFRGKR